MIVLTVGTQLPFNRLVQAADEWCRRAGRDDVVGQIGAIGASDYRPQSFRWQEFMAPPELDSLVRGAQLVVAHAGMGSIISALRYSRPIVIMPRRAALGEHRNDHQVGTASRFANRAGVFVADSEADLGPAIDRALTHSSVGSAGISAYAEPSLLEAVSNFIRFGSVDRGSGDQ